MYYVFCILITTYMNRLYLGTHRKCICMNKNILIGGFEDNGLYLFYSQICFSKINEIILKTNKQTKQTKKKNGTQ